MPQIKFVHTGGPFGDATDNYDVEFPTGWTVRDFIRYIVTDYSINSCNIWGSFSVSGRGYSNKPISEYNRGVLYQYEWSSEYFGPELARKLREQSKKTLEEVLDVKLVRVTANGGWSNMGYNLYIEEE